MEHQNTKFKIRDIKDYIPEKIKPWILILFVIIYQLSSGVYLAAVGEMCGSLALMHEDIMMAGYASMVGLALTFAVMFRLKFRFSIKTSLITTATGLIICNLITMNTSSVPLLVAVSLISGFFRMWGTFSCNTTIQLWVTPKRDMAVWFVFIYLLVQGAIQLSGLFTIYTSVLGTWEHVHLMMTGLLSVVLFVTMTIFQHFRQAEKISLSDIDWVGIMLWAITMLSAIFILNYGSHYDWFSSEYIRIGGAVFIISLAMNLWRARTTNSPFIELATWRYKNVWMTAILYLVVDLLLSPSHLFEHLYMETVLQYDSQHAISLNWIVFCGIVCGAVFSYITFAKHNWRYKTMTFIGFSMIVGYLITMYFIVDYDVSKEVFWLPLFIRGAGSVVVAIAFITSLTIIPFENFAQSLTIQGFFSACIGSLLGTTILRELLVRAHMKNLNEISANFDGFFYPFEKISMDVAYPLAQRHALLESMKELYGYLAIIGLICIVIFFVRESALRQKFIGWKSYWRSYLAAINAGKKIHLVFLPGEKRYDDPEPLPVKLANAVTAEDLTRATCAQ